MHYAVSCDCHLRNCTNNYYHLMTSNISNRTLVMLKQRRWRRSSTDTWSFLRLYILRARHLGIEKQQQSDTKRCIMVKQPAAQRRAASLIARWFPVATPGRRSSHSSSRIARVTLRFGGKKLASALFFGNGARSSATPCSRVTGWRRRIKYKMHFYTHFHL